METIYETGMAITNLVREKNSGYGNAANKTADILKILYPNGISTKDYHDALLLLRVLDKICRIANGQLEDSWRDIAGYGILGEWGRENK